MESYHATISTGVALAWGETLRVGRALHEEVALLLQETAFLSTEPLVVVFHLEHCLIMVGNALGDHRLGYDGIRDRRGGWVD